jgi:WhiB family redox-sensing transcriptional regulator
MVDELDEDRTPYQPPILTELEAAREGVALEQRRSVEWLMAPEAPELQSLLDLFNRPAWHNQANCRGADPNLFFPEWGDARPVEALAYCARCPVTSECLAASTEVPGTVGVWASTMQRGRRGMRRGAA